MDDDGDRRKLFAHVLRHEGYQVDQLPSGARLVERVREQPPDLVLLDVMLPESSGFELCGDLRMLDDTRLTPIILVSSAFLDERSVVRGLLSGADDYVATPLRLEELRARVRVQLRNRRDREMLEWARVQREALQTAAMSDALTGLANRRAADQWLDEALEAGERLLVIVIDVDHFKHINDTQGHGAGDGALTQIGRMLQSCTRAGDLAARYGGDEFLVAVREADLQTAARIGERYLAAVRTSQVAGLPVTASIGIAGTSAGCYADREAVLAAADRALYEAKLSGRDRVMVCAEPVVGGLATSGHP